MKIMVCDRCHKTMNYIYDAYRFKVKNLDSMQDSDDINGHLCSECRRDLDNWMRDVRKKDEKR